MEALSLSGEKNLTKKGAKALFYCKTTPTRLQLQKNGFWLMDGRVISVVIFAQVDTSWGFLRNGAKNNAH